ncbi:MAG: hypothetical protein FWC16_02325 [Defluviitaleaceae bacterium]|nr:hypothetical protein [Defluviitaleaceae bacterium]MCL2273735.1 hypothetical protein [Defluviitaleaceae bacterium]
MFALFILSLIPLLIISHSALPTQDDFWYGIPAAQAWQETGSITQTVNAAVQRTQYAYETWQGTFVAIFFMSAHPAIFGAGFYMLGVIFVILMFASANLFFLKVILMDYLKMDKYTYGIVTLLFTFISMQFVFSAREGFFWYNSAMFYSGFHSLSLFMLGMLGLALKEESEPSKISYILVPIFAFLVGGSNFISALTSAVVLALVLAWLGYKHFCIKAKVSMQKWLVPILGFAAISVSLIIAITAPGNALRQVILEESGYGIQMNPILAILQSFRHGFLFFTTFRQQVLPFPVWIALGCMIPIIYNATRQIVQKGVFIHKYSILVVPLFYGVYASTFTPNLYSMSSFGPNRVVNVNFYWFLLFVFVAMIFICGNIAAILGTSHSSFLVEKSSGKDSSSISKTAAIGLAIFVLSCVFIATEDVNSMMSTSAARSVITGEARTYRIEYFERIERLREPGVNPDEIPFFTVFPYVLPILPPGDNDEVVRFFR